MFTDDDLKHFKYVAKEKIGAGPSRFVGRAELEGLLERLDAAEKCVRHSHVCNESGHGCDCGFENWNKTKGNLPYTTLEPGEYRIEKTENPEPRYIREEDI